MSGIAKGIGKVFKKVAKVAKKVLPIVLAGAAIYFTAGAALGVTPAFGAAMGQLATSVGAQGVLGNVLAGSLTQAGYGAVLGGATSLLTGQDPLKGAQVGAVGGAVTGGLTGAAGLNPDPMAGVFEKNAPAAGADALAGGAGADTLAAGTGPVKKPLVGQGGGGLLSGSTGGGAQAAAGGPGVFGQGGWLERNQALMGPVLQGAGAGLLSFARADDEESAMLKRDENERKYVRRNYGRGLVPGYRSFQSGASGQYVYDPDRGRIVYKSPQELAAEEGA